MNDLYANERPLRFNFFHPCIKRIGKVRIESRIKKKYDKAHAPYQRLIKSDCLVLEQKIKLQDKFIIFNLYLFTKKHPKKA